MPCLMCHALAYVERSFDRAFQRLEDKFGIQRVQVRHEKSPKSPGAKRQSSHKKWQPEVVHFDRPPDVAIGALVVSEGLI